ncbi:hypothetical protein [Helicobacter sp. 11S02596-1]|uniref:hypothetical protein n=1 Tax=Helicobacter sp. 11S02596-1 TaxID=1476194 RepID=UPI000BA55937|nr:hypothetical protein [Helicobacter sp. 11S02596-1]PAF42355.1 hypothetical protein BJI48_07010 [Helicobacter sp. 11S02596-1]
MFSSIFKSLESYIQNKNKKELYILLGVLWGLIFALIYFLLLPPISDNLTQQKEAYAILSLAYAKNLSHLQKISQNPQEKNIEINKQAQEVHWQQAFRHAAINNYALLKMIENLATKLQLQITSDITNTGDDLLFCLEGRFQDFTEWLRYLEQNYFVFIEDFHLFFKENTLAYQIHIKNLGNSL